MGKLKKEINYKIIVEPRRLGDRLLYGDQEEILKAYKERCDEILADIRRHVNNVGTAYIEIETEEICEYCGYPWTEDSEEFNGGCCEKDLEEEIENENR